MRMRKEQAIMPIILSTFIPLHSFLSVIVSAVAARLPRWRFRVRPLRSRCTRWNERTSAHTRERHERRRTKRDHARALREWNREIDLILHTWPHPRRVFPSCPDRRSQQLTAHPPHSPLQP